MAIYNLEEQEKIDALKAWWKQYGAMITLIFVLAIIVFLGIRGWREYRDNQAVKAGALYSDLQKSIAAKEIEKSQGILKTLTEKYPGTSYTARAALVTAKIQHESGNNEVAKNQLNWIIKEAREEDLQNLARLRLAGILLDEKNYQEALKLVETKHIDTFDPLYLGLKGDILIATGKPAEARNAYQLALDKTDAKHPFKNYLQLKVDALGGNK